MSTLPLEDVRILAIEQYGAGPYGSLHLADLGADVIKIEDPPQAVTSAATSHRSPPGETASSSRRSTATSAASSLI